MSVIAVIPARYASSRFPGKLLAADTGKYLIQHVYERVIQASILDSVIIAADDERIGQTCEEFGARWQMTDVGHASGTDRIAEAVGNSDAKIIVNVQGDEPEIQPDHIDQLVACLQNDTTADMATLSSSFLPGEDINNPNVVKVVTDNKDHALYFSRWPIPYHRDEAKAVNNRLYLKHIGIYAYRKDALLKLSGFQPTPLEISEKLEQLRALENQMMIAVTQVAHHAVGIDTPEQYRDFVKRYREKSP